jgi:hypothetical protein
MKTVLYAGISRKDNANGRRTTRFLPQEAQKNRVLRVNFYRLAAGTPIYARKRRSKKRSEAGAPNRFQDFWRLRLGYWINKLIPKAL